MTNREPDAGPNLATMFLLGLLYEDVLHCHPAARRELGNDVLRGEIKVVK